MIKNTWMIYLCFLLFAYSQAAHLKQDKMALHFSLDSSYLTYQERTEAAADFMHSNTVLLGIHADFEKKLNPDWGIGPSVRLAYGNEN